MSFTSVSSTSMLIIWISQIKSWPCSKFMPLSLEVLFLNAVTWFLFYCIPPFVCKPLFLTRLPKFWVWIDDLPLRSFRDLHKVCLPITNSPSITLSNFSTDLKSVVWLIVTICLSLFPSDCPILVGAFSDLDGRKL